MFEISVRLISWLDFVKHFCKTVKKIYARMSVRVNSLFMVQFVFSEKEICGEKFFIRREKKAILCGKSEKNI